MTADALPPFLARLSLGRNADTAAIEHAYARELGLLDAQADQTAAQSLRQAYEVALRWAGLEASRLAGAPLANAAALASAAYARLDLAAKKLAAGGGLDDTAPWETELRTRLAEPELRHPSVRRAFEERLVQRLAAPWHASHAPLLMAAISVLDWSRDGSHLQQFGAAGTFVLRAVAQRQVFAGQGDTAMQAQSEVLTRLRAGGMPHTEHLGRDLLHLERMAFHFPALLAVMANPQIVSKWRRAFGVPARARSTPVASEIVDSTPEPVLYKDPSKRRRDWAWILFAILALATVARLWYGYQASKHTGKMFNFGDPFARGEPKRPVPMPAPAPMPSWEQRASAQGPAIVDQDTVQAIFDDMTYKPGRFGPNGEHIVEFELTIDRYGRVMAMTKLRGSRDAIFDDEVANAIGRAKPFVPVTNRYLRLRIDGRQFEHAAAAKRARRGKDSRRGQ
ncbi:MAG: TonB C-terminal domain-containing protein [Massilia sp.]